MVSDSPSARSSVLAPTAPHTGAILEERKHSDFSCDAALIVEHIDRGYLTCLEALLEGGALPAHYDRAFTALIRYLL